MSFLARLRAWLYDLLHQGPEETVAVEGTYSLEVQVQRCGCGDPESHLHPPSPCPTPIVEDRGVVSEGKIHGDTHQRR